jgi:hypothetical protein
MIKKRKARYFYQALWELLGSNPTLYIVNCQLFTKKTCKQVVD